MLIKTPGIVRRFWVSSSKHLPQKVSHLLGISSLGYCGKSPWRGAGPWSSLWSHFNSPRGGVYIIATLVILLKGPSKVRCSSCFWGIIAFCCLVMYVNVLLESYMLHTAWAAGAGPAKPWQTQEEKLSISFYLPLASSIDKTWFPAHQEDVSIGWVGYIVYPKNSHVEVSTHKTLEWE